MIDDLTKLAIKYGCDRHPGAKHSYTPYYENLFKERKNTIGKLLEIGVGGHAGLRMWRDYFSNAIIYGAEIDPDRVYNEERIKVFHCDQSQKKDLEDLISKFGRDFDIVIDDGSHKTQDQIFTCVTLMPLLNKDCVYIIEDVADPAIVNKLTDYKVEIPEIKWKKDRFDDKLIVVRHN